jgi:phytoene dehydrogenase-like protein
VGAIEADAPFLFALLGGELWSWPTAKLMIQQAWKRGLRGLAAWMGEALRPIRAWLEPNYSSDLVQALWAPWALHTGLTTESAYGGQMGKVIAFALEAAGAPVVKGGAGQAVEAFRRLIEENGGELRSGADVDRILVRKRQGLRRQACRRHRTLGIPSHLLRGPRPALQPAAAR